VLFNNKGKKGGKMKINTGIGEVNLYGYLEQESSKTWRKHLHGFTHAQTVVIPITPIAEKVEFVREYLNTVGKKFFIFTIKGYKFAVSEQIPGIIVSVRETADGGLQAVTAVTQEQIINEGGGTLLNYLKLPY